MKVSLITIVLNGRDHIEKTIQSVLAQDYPDIEYIVQDGVSSDGTLEIIGRYRDRISVFNSEPDKGISDAWNKALARVGGEVVGLINAGDQYAPDAVSAAVKTIAGGADMTYGDTELVDEEGLVRIVNKGRFHIWKYSAGLGFYHPSVFARKSLYDRIGGFDVKLRYAMDTDWMVRAYMAGAQIRKADTRTRMLDAGVSVRNRFLAYGEHLHSMQRAGVGELTIYKNVIATGVRGLVRVLWRGERQA